MHINKRELLKKISLKVNRKAKIISYVVDIKILIMTLVIQNYEKLVVISGESQKNFLTYQYVIGRNDFDF